MGRALSVVILTKNSAAYLDEVLQSAAFADEVLVVDGGSRDDTLAIAERHGVRIESQAPWRGFGHQKQHAIDLATHDWVFVLDSDEVITQELREEILSTLQNPQATGYLVPRLNYFFGKPIRYGGLYPDATIRLFDRTKGHFTPDEVHEKVVVNGPVASLHHPMRHYAYEYVAQFIDKQNRYAQARGKPNRLKALLNPWWTFFRMYVLKLGFLDGWEGFVIARLYGQYTFWKYIVRKSV
ncbi:glycosyltransferase family 2 protein [Hydrogenimonas sp.]